MTIIAQRLVNPNGDTEDQIGFQLFLKTWSHFINFLGQTGLAYGYSACNAGVAIDSHADYDPVVVVPFVPFSAVYGSSRLYAGLDPDFNALHGNIAPTRPFSSSHLGEHAEQSAIRVVDNNFALDFWDHNGHHHLYVDLNPCGNCTNWLNNDNRDWFVHYFANINFQSPVVNKKKRDRKIEFGRITESNKRQKDLTGNRRLIKL